MSRPRARKFDDVRRRRAADDRVKTAGPGVEGLPPFEAVRITIVDARDAADRSGPVVKNFFDDVRRNPEFGQAARHGSP